MSYSQQPPGQQPPQGHGYGYGPPTQPGYGHQPPPPPPDKSGNLGVILLLVIGLPLLLLGGCGAVFFVLTAEQGSVAVRDVLETEAGDNPPDVQLDPGTDPPASAAPQQSSAPEQSTAPEQTAAPEQSTAQQQPAQTQP
ncbi:hypothetical protein [Nonomuraea sp. 10N515B]|uniref:hypothetical protein n=1 Tax=Nonomuraea sp. 10N515B TaxID=3457422 RepID=UPI003FCC4679